MRIIITENKRNSVITNWLNNFYGNLTKKTAKRYIIFSDNNVNSIFLYYRSTKNLTLSDKLTDELVSMFNVTSDDLNKIMIPWFKKTYGLPVNNAEFTTRYCTTCGSYHITRHHIDE